MPTAGPAATAGEAAPPVTAYVGRPRLEAALRTHLLPGRGLLVLGDAGVGKSRLVGAVLPGALVTSVSTARFGSARDLVADLLAQVSDPPEVLLRVLRQGGAGSEESDLLTAAGRELARLSPHVVVEDAELLSDREALQLGTALEGSGVTWVLVCRRPLPGLDLPAVRVGPLEPDESDALVEALLPGASELLGATLRERVGGHPLQLELSARVLLEGGDLSVAEGRAQSMVPGWQSRLPTSLAEFAARRLALLPAAEREVLGTAAVLGDGLEPALLQHLAPHAARVLGGLEGRGLLRRVPSPSGEPALSFAHAVLREAAYADVDTGAKRRLHLAAAEWYAVLPVSQVLEAQADHLEAALLQGEADCDLVRRTVDAMALFARSIQAERPVVARDVVERALGYAAEHPRCAADTLPLLLSSSALAFTAGEDVRAVDVATQALALAESRGDRVAVAEAYLLAGQGITTADAALSLAHFDRAADLYRQLDDLAGEARTLAQRAILLQHQEGIPQQLAELERAYQVAVRSGDARLQSSTALDLALHHAICSGRHEHEAWVERVEHAARRDDLTVHPMLDLSLAALAFYGLDPQPAIPAAQAALSAGRQLGMRLVVMNAVTIVAGMATASGLLDEGRQVVLDLGRPLAATRPTPWFSLQLDLLEARREQRSGRVAEARALLDHVAGHELAQHAVLARDLGEARAWVALERGHFAEARALASQAAVACSDLGERVPSLRPRLVGLVAAVADGQTPALSDLAELRDLCRTTQLPVPAELAMRWIYVDELTRGWTVDLYGLSDVDVIEARALDLEIEALSQQRFDLLAEAAEVWAELGTTVWRARALLWHSELTGTPHPEATELLDVLRAPDDLEQELRGQVRGLRA
jgi:hypothetical protein